MATRATSTITMKKGTKKKRPAQQDSNGSIKIQRMRGSSSDVSSCCKKKTINAERLSQNPGKDLERNVVCCEGH